MDSMEDFRCHEHELEAFWNVWNPDDPFFISASDLPSRSPSKSEFQLQLVTTFGQCYVVFSDDDDENPNPTTQPFNVVAQETTHHSAKIFNVDRLYRAKELSGIISSELLKSHDELRRWSGRLNAVVSDIIQKIHSLIAVTEGTERRRNDTIRVAVDLTWLHVCDETILIQELLLEENDGMIPASKSATKEMLKKVDFEDDDDDEPCRVCLEEMGRDDVLCMPCSHRFHGECILKWLHNSHYCPICRFEIPTE